MATKEQFLADAVEKGIQIVRDKILHNLNFNYYPLELPDPLADQMV